eukprot:g18950.t1
MHEEVVVAVISDDFALRQLGGSVSNLVKPFVIGVCGATCSGKTSLCDIFRKNLKNNLRVAFIPSDAFYKDLSESDRQLAYRSQYDFDHPDAIAWDELVLTLKTLKDGCQAVEIPRYDFVTHSRIGGTISGNRISSSRQINDSKAAPEKKKGADHLDLTDAVVQEPPQTPVVPPTSTTKGSGAGGELIRPADVIIVEGILIYAVGPELRAGMDLKIFVDCDADVILARRMQRDIRERGRDMDGVLRQYMKFVKPSYENFIEPSKRYADVIIPNTKDAEMERNSAILMMVQHIKHQLEKRNSARKLMRGCVR